MGVSRNVVILVFPDVEVLDFAGPYEVFSQASGAGRPQDMNVRIIAQAPGPVRARNGLRILPDHFVGEKGAPKPDILVIPGGPGIRREKDNPALIQWVRECAPGAEIVLSVCTGALLLGKAGLLDGLTATTHHGALELLRMEAPKVKVVEKRYVDNGRIVTSAGVSAGIDASLHVVERLVGSARALETARDMEYIWGGSEPA